MNSLAVVSEEKIGSEMPSTLRAPMEGVEDDILSAPGDNATSDSDESVAPRTEDIRVQNKSLEENKNTEVVQFEEFTVRLSKEAKKAVEGEKREEEETRRRREAKRRREFKCTTSFERSVTRISICCSRRIRK